MRDPFSSKPTSSKPNASHPNDAESCAIRDAASVIAVRRDGLTPEMTPQEQVQNLRVLMGQRAKGAVFMPQKVVFPGGGVDRVDHEGTAESQPKTMSAACLERIQYDTQSSAHSLTQAALRELREETGLHLRADTTMRFVFRAVTPIGRTRRYDARFFLLEASQIESDLEDFSQAEDELSNLSWLTLEQAFAQNIANITRLVLQHVERCLLAPDEDLPVPFYDMRTADGQLRFIA